MTDQVTSTLAGHTIREPAGHRCRRSEADAVDD